MRRASSDPVFLLYVPSRLASFLSSGGHCIRGAAAAWLCQDAPTALHNINAKRFCVMSAADITRAMLADFDITPPKSIPLTMRHQSAARLKGHNL